MDKKYDMIGEKGRTWQKFLFLSIFLTVHTGFQYIAISFGGVINLNRISRE